jgi:hypothetical protein
MMSSVSLSLEYREEQLNRIGIQNRQKSWELDEQNLADVFEWLKIEKGVQTIVKLTVKDNPDYCCTDETVGKCLEGLEVRYLDWNRPDICADSLQSQTNLIELSLYWTGLNAVLRSWSDTEGISTFVRVCTV